MNSCIIIYETLNYMIELPINVKKTKKKFSTYIDELQKHFFLN